METIREILAAHGSGISKPGLLAWARLRIDTGMTDAQLDEELALLGDEVVDEQGFLYLRSLRSPAPPSAWASNVGAGGEGEPAPGDEGANDQSGDGRQAASADASRDASQWFEVAPRAAETWTPPQAARRGIGGVGRVIGVGVFLLWLVSLVGGFVGGGPEPAETPVPSVAQTPTTGSVISSDEIALGDCLVLPTEDQFSEVRRVGCDTPHGGEVFLVADHPDGAYPSDEAFGSYTDTVCSSAFRSWTGSDVDAQDLLDYSWFMPTEEGWTGGDRAVLCYLYLADGTLADSSYRGTSP